jgi:hypothetical protein
MAEREEREKRGGDRKSKFHDGTLISLSDLGVEKMQSHRWQAIAGVPPKSACAQNGKPGKS